jgi:hypothetical protein
MTRRRRAQEQVLTSGLSSMWAGRLVERGGWRTRRGELHEQGERTGKHKTTQQDQPVADIEAKKLPSRPGEFHPEPLTDPYVNLSIHTARVIARRLPPSAEPSGSSRFDPVGPWSTAMTCPLCSTGITPLHHYYRAVRPSPAHRYFRPRGWSRLCLFPWHRRPGSHVPYKSQIELRAVYMPDAAWAVSGHPPS